MHANHRSVLICKQKLEVHGWRADLHLAMCKELRQAHRRQVGHRHRAVAAGSGALAAALRKRPVGDCVSHELLTSAPWPRRLKNVCEDRRLSERTHQRREPGSDDIDCLLHCGLARRAAGARSLDLWCQSREAVPESTVFTEFADP